MILKFGLMGKLELKFYKFKFLGKFGSTRWFIYRSNFFLIEFSLDLNEKSNGVNKIKSRINQKIKIIS